MNVGALSVLVIDDEAMDAEILRRGLAGIDGLVATLVHEASAEAGLQAARAGHFDLVFVDNRLGDAEGPDVVLELCRSGVSAAIIGYSGLPQLEEAFLQAGATSFLSKDCMDVSSLRQLIADLAVRE